MWQMVAIKRFVQYFGAQSNDKQAISVFHQPEKG